MMRIQADLVQILANGGGLDLVSKSRTSASSLSGLRTTYSCGVSGIVFAKRNAPARRNAPNSVGAPVGLNRRFVATTAARAPAPARPAAPPGRRTRRSPSRSAQHQGDVGDNEKAYVRTPGPFL